MSNRSNQHNVDARVRAAFEAQNREIKKMGEAFNTMRLLSIMLIKKFAPEDGTVTLSAAELNATAEKLKFLGINVDNKAMSDEVVLTLIDNETETTMSVTDDVLAPNETAPVENKPEHLIEFPTFCQCTHTNKRHIGSIGGCKESSCSCTEFIEEKSALRRLVQ